MQVIWGKNERKIGDEFRYSMTMTITISSLVA